MSNEEDFRKAAYRWIAAKITPVQGMGGDLWVQVAKVRDALEAAGAVPPIVDTDAEKKPEKSLVDFE